MLVSPKLRVMANDMYISMHTTPDACQPQAESWPMICTFSFITWSTVVSNWPMEADSKDAKIHTWHLSAPSWESWAQRDFWRWVAFGLCEHIHIRHSYYTADQGVQPSHKQPASQNRALCVSENDPPTHPPKKHTTTTNHTPKNNTHKTFSLSLFCAI